MTRSELKNFIEILNKSVNQKRHWLVKNHGNPYASKVTNDLREDTERMSELKSKLWKMFPTMDEAIEADELQAFEMIREHHKAVTDEEKAIEAVLWSKIRTLEVKDIINQ